jgi:hypothetical protein
MLAEPAGWLSSGFDRFAQQTTAPMTAYSPQTRSIWQRL